MRKLATLLILAGAAMAAAPAVAATNIIPTGTTSITSSGTDGVLRAGSAWAVGTTSDPALAGDGSFVPEGQDWNIGSFWWDQDPSVNRTPVYLTFNLNGLYTIDSFVAQADDNDSYLVEYWDGATWQSAWDIAPVYTYGLVSRSSGALTPITTNALRFSATGGDNYYAVSELQAFGTLAGAVPEPATWAMMILGFGMIGGTLRSRRRKLAFA
jgi:hypothetical protein